MKNDIYCQYEFLESFINQLKGKDIIEYLNSGDDYGIDLYRLLFNSSKIELDKSDEEIIQLSKVNPYINKLFKSQSLKPSHINVPNLIFEEIKPNTIFFLKNSQLEVEKLQEKYGMWFFSKDRMRNTKELFKLMNHNFSSSLETPFKNFDFFHKYRHPCNALILTDDYFFTSNNKYDENAIEKNLKPILKQILPKKLGVNFQITMILSPNSVSLDFDKIQLVIEEITATYAYEIKINFIVSNFHERHIFTNYYKITTDKGFKNLVKNNTWVHDKNSFEFRSIFHSNDEDYLAKIEECNSKEKDSSRNTKNKTNVGDNFKNRLLSLAKQL